MVKLQPDSYLAPAEVIQAAFAEAGADEVTFLARQCLEVGAWDHAIAICEALDDGAAPGVSLCLAVAHFVGGNPERAFAVVDALLARQPRNLSALLVKAQLLVRSGQPAEAAPLLSKLVQHYPDYPAAQGLLASVLMPGPHYREVLSRIHERLEPRSYVELGIDTGTTLALARNAELILGVDPAEVPLHPGVPAHAQVFRLTSDAFFSQHSRESLLGVRHVDLAFIDGLHRFEAALQDFINLEAWSGPQSTIVLHDCVPLNARCASRERRSKFWVGDTWKVVRALRAYRPELRIRTLLTPPSGLTVVRRLEPGSRLLAGQFAQIVERFAEDTWDYEPGSYMPELELVSNDEAGLREALA